MMGLGLIIIIIILGAGIFLINGSKGNITSLFTNQKDKSAKEILQERYARGEIEKDEFVQKMNDLL